MCYEVHTFVQTALLAIFIMYSVVGWVPGLLLLVHHQYWILTKTPARYSTAARNHGEPVAVVAQDPSLHKVQHITDGVSTDVGETNPSRACVPGWELSWSVQVSGVIPLL